MTLNQHALSELIRERELKQWWIARQIGVAPLTVNRWLTGKVRRISRDNLSRLSGVLRCEEGSLVRDDEAADFATQVEQSHAAGLLTTRETQQLFISSGMYEAYEKLLKSTMHPNMPLSMLVSVYSSLCMASAERGLYEQARLYGERCLEYARRENDPSNELASRSDLIAIEGASGNLQLAVDELEELFSMLESMSFPRGSGAALMNLIYANWLKGEFTRCAALVRPFLDHRVGGGAKFAESEFRIHSAQVALDCSQPALALELSQRAQDISAQPENVERRVHHALLELLAGSLMAKKLPCELPEGAAEAIAEFMALPRRDETQIIRPAILLRRAGRLDEAEALLAAAEAADKLRVYDPPFIAKERARIAAARGRAEDLLKHCELARAGYLSFGMTRRARQMDKAIATGAVPELGSFRLPAAHLQLLRELVA